MGKSHFDVNVTVQNYGQVSFSPKSWNNTYKIRHEQAIIYI